MAFSSVVIIVCGFRSYYGARRFSRPITLFLEIKFTLKELSIMSFATVIKNRREDLGLTQEDLADLANVSKSSIQNYEHGKSIPSSCNMRALAEALSIDVNDLVQASKMQL